VHPSPSTNPRRCFHGRSAFHTARKRNTSATRRSFVPVAERLPFRPLVPCRKRKRVRYGRNAPVGGEGFTSASASSWSQSRPTTRKRTRTNQPSPPPEPQLRSPLAPGARSRTYDRHRAFDPRLWWPTHSAAEWCWLAMQNALPVFPHQRGALRIRAAGTQWLRAFHGAVPRCPAQSRALTVDPPPSPPPSDGARPSPAR